MTRRSFLKQTAAAAGLLIVAPSCEARGAASQGVLVNHVGFTAGGAKWCLLAGTAERSFDVIELTSRRVVHRGRLEFRKGDHGDYLVGDFSALREPGKYEVRAGEARSGGFLIAGDVYLPVLRDSIAYFAVQRCGDSKSGYHAPCHLDDGRRKDNGKHQDVVGGWHDACDVRRWVDATLYGMTGLSRVLDVLGPTRVNARRIVDEMRWGNQYFLKMQDPAGLVMRHCGADEGNHFTDNVIGTADDRPIDTEPGELTAQFNFIAVQASVARQVREIDPAYAKTCENAAHSAMSWCLSKRPRKASSLAAAVIACVQLHRAGSGDERPRDLGRRYMAQLLALQVRPVGDGHPGERGFFRADATGPDPSREIMDGNLPLIALCDAIDALGDHPNADAWRAALRLHVDHLLALENLSAFGTIPFGLYLGNDPGGGRQLGKHWYRWFMKRNNEYRPGDWWVGINAHLASHGVGLAKASRTLQRPDLLRSAQRQLDWILGVNPFDASTVTGAGRNHPRLFVTGQFKPPTPPIPGGVMNGIGGTDADQPCLDSGSYNTSEYWTPMVAYTMWLLAELTASRA
ncbi:MAG: glycoside hydrolase family 9 protein [Tepidisphaeraceae bacterium]